MLVCIAPDGPPENLTSVCAVNSITFQWLPPSIPNGIIHRYTFSIFTAANTTTKELLADQRTITFRGLQPSQLYAVSVTASTFFNGIYADSPPATLIESTLPDSELFIHHHLETSFHSLEFIHDYIEVQ